ncbi:hypothetical protein FQZ97_786080 [compost metagenome]
MLDIIIKQKGIIIVIVNGRPFHAFPGNLAAGYLKYMEFMRGAGLFLNLFK